MNPAPLVEYKIYERLVLIVLLSVAEHPSGQARFAVVSQRLSPHDYYNKFIALLQTFLP